MKRKIFYLLLFISLSQFSCKKFLNVEPIEKLAGNQYWKNSKDVEAFTTDIYAQLWDKLSGSSFWPSAGEQRFGEMRTSNTGVFNSNDVARRSVYNYLVANDLKVVVNGLTSSSSWLISANGASNFSTQVSMNFVSITQWAEFYRAIQGANILAEEVNKGIPGLTNEETARYAAEAVFIRSLCYFIMVRLYGDVPYFTDAYHSEPLPRENSVTVLNNCIKDLEAVKNSLPWRYPDPALNGVRANRGGAISLLMNMNMWNAGFDPENKQKYYESAAALGTEIIKSNQYQLLPLAEFPSVFLANSAEGLIELKENVAFVSSSNRLNKVAFQGEALVVSPNKSSLDNGSTSHAHYMASYIHKLYDADPTDGRFINWYENPFIENGAFGMNKFSGQVSPQGLPDWGLILFRYADAILLHAEALAELSRDSEAIISLNLIRARAEAASYSGAGGQELKDAIFLERGKELIGEGYRFFDLVRTRKILNDKWTSRSLSASQFNNGAWTWPIHISARDRNPYIKLNDYWL